MRKRSIEEGFVEQVTLINHGTHPAAITVRL
jgi:hypothetical protein